FVCMYVSRLLLLLYPHVLHYFFFFTDPSTTEIYTLSLHDALPISNDQPCFKPPTTEGSAAGMTTYRSEVTPRAPRTRPARKRRRSEEHTSELQSRRDLVCRLLLEKKKKKHMRA